MDAVFERSRLFVLLVVTMVLFPRRREPELPSGDALPVIEKLVATLELQRAVHELGLPVQDDRPSLPSLRLPRDPTARRARKRHYTCGLAFSKSFMAGPLPYLEDDFAARIRVISGGTIDLDAAEPYQPHRAGTSEPAVRCTCTWR